MNAIRTQLSSAEISYANGKRAEIANKLRDGGTAQFEPWLAALEGSKSKMLDLVQLYSVGFRRIPNLGNNSASSQFLGALNRSGQSQRTTWRRVCLIAVYLSRRRYINDGRSSMHKKCSSSLAYSSGCEWTP